MQHFEKTLPCIINYNIVIICMQVNKKPNQIFSINILNDEINVYKWMLKIRREGNIIKGKFNYYRSTLIVYLY